VRIEFSTTGNPPYTLLSPPAGAPIGAPSCGSRLRRQDAQRADEDYAHRGQFPAAIGPVQGGLSAADNRSDFAASDDRCVESMGTLRKP